MICPALKQCAAPAYEQPAAIPQTKRNRREALASDSKDWTTLAG